MVARREPNRTLTRREPDTEKNIKNDDISILNTGPSTTTTTTPPITPTKKRTIDNAFPENETPHKKHKDTVETTGLETPCSPQSSIYSKAKALFQRGAAESGIIGREEERQKLNDFFIPLIREKSHGALYISGLPGTGKSALLSEVISGLLEQQHGDIKVANINCMIVDKPHLIFSTIYKNLTAKNSKAIKKHKPQHAEEEDNIHQLQTAVPSSKTIQKLEQLFLNPKTATRHIVVLDELDHVVTKDQEVMFKIFQWAFAKNSNLVLVGIANALDLTDRFLPRLRSNNLTPETLSFSPYSANQIAHIIECRLRLLLGSDQEEEEEIPLMHPAAIQLCARKTAANTGDLRKAFDICRRAIELVEEDVRKKQAERDEEAYGGNAWKKALVSGNITNDNAGFNLDNTPKVTVMNISKICSVAFGGSTVTRVKGLNLQQKAVLSVLVVNESTLATTMTVMKLFDLYSQTCNRDNMLARLQLGEFYEIISALESAGVVNVSGICGRKGMGSTKPGTSNRSSKGGTGAGSSKASSLGGGRDDYSQRKITTNVHKMDLMTSIDDVPLLKHLLGVSK